VTPSEGKYGFLAADPDACLDRDRNPDGGGWRLTASCIIGICSYGSVRVVYRIVIQYLRFVTRDQSSTHALERVDMLVGVVWDPATGKTGRVGPLGSTLILPCPEYPSLSSVLVGLLIISHCFVYINLDSQSEHPRIAVGSP